jgi:gamma-glutamyl hercynylcysteine S-oxide synthase
MNGYKVYAKRILNDNNFTHPIQFHDPAVITLDQVYVPILTAHTKEDDEARGLRAFKPKSAQEQAVVEPAPAEHLTAVEMVNREKRLVILGEDGQGKTTFLRYLTLCLLGESLNHAQYSLKALKSMVDRKADAPSLQAQQWDIKDVLPIYLDLNLLAECFASETEYLSSNAVFWKMVTAIYPEVDNPLNSDLPKLILLDHGEAIPDESSWVLWMERINALCLQDDTLRVVLTSTQESYRNRTWRPEGFVEEKLLPFTSMQRKMFLEKISAIGLSILQTGYQADAEKKTQIIPLHLMLLCLAGGEVSDVPQAMEKISLSYLQRFGILPESKLNAELVIGKFTLQSMNQNETVHSADLFNALQPYLNTQSCSSAAIKKSLDTDSFLFQSNGRDAYGFRHPYLRDYYSAVYLLHTQFPDLVLSMVKEAPLKWKNISKVLFKLLMDQDDTLSWQLANLLLSSGGDGLDERNGMLAFLVAESLRGYLSRFPEVLINQIRTSMQQILDHGWLSPYERDQAGRILSILGDQRNLKQLISIPSGSFYLGNHRQPNSAPEHMVSLPSFKIGKYPITIAFYREFAEATQRKWIAIDKLNIERQNAPAVDLTWHDALAFCAWLTEQWQITGQISKNEIVRLPTEAEWEYAARGNRSMATLGDIQVIYPWGTEWQDDHCNSLELGFNDTCVVGMFPKGASPFHCLDMCGQVWEWISTLWGVKMDHPDILFPYDADDGRENLLADEAIRRVLRGGSFSSPSQKTSCTYRGSLEPAGSWRGDGFRIVVAEK